MPCLQPLSGFLLLEARPSPSMWHHSWDSAHHFLPLVCFICSTVKRAHPMRPPTFTHPTFPLPGMSFLPNQHSVRPSPTGRNTPRPQSLPGLLQQSWASSPRGPTGIVTLAVAETAVCLSPPRVGTQFHSFLYCHEPTIKMQQYIFKTQHSVL